MMFIVERATSVAQWLFVVYLLVVGVNMYRLTRYPSRTKHAGADVFSTFKGATQISDSVASAPVDRHSLGGKVHISFCQS